MNKPAETRTTSAAINTLQDLQRTYNALRAERDGTEPSNVTYDSLERRLASMRRQATKFIKLIHPSAAVVWKRAFGMV